MESVTLLLVLVSALLLTSATPQHSREDESALADINTKNTLLLLRTIKRRVEGRLRMQEETDKAAQEDHGIGKDEDEDVFDASINNNNNNNRYDGRPDVEAGVQAFSVLKRRHQQLWRQRPQPQTCRGWNDYCVPWTSDPEKTCCNVRSNICSCNLWLQNCRCQSRGWGR